MRSRIISFALLLRHCSCRPWFVFEIRTELYLNMYLFRFPRTGSGLSKLTYWKFQSETLLSSHLSTGYVVINLKPIPFGCVHSSVWRRRMFCLPALDWPQARSVALSIDRAFVIKVNLLPVALLYYNWLDLKACSSMFWRFHWRFTLLHLEYSSFTTSKYCYA